MFSAHESSRVISYVSMLSVWMLNRILDDSKGTFIGTKDRNSMHEHTKVMQLLPLVVSLSTTTCNNVFIYKSEKSNKILFLFRPRHKHISKINKCHRWSFNPLWWLKKSTWKYAIDKKMTLLDSCEYNNQVVPTMSKCSLCIY